MAERKRRPRTVDTIREHSQGLIEMMKATPRECWSRSERAKIRGFITEALEILENDPEERVEFIRFIRNMFKDCARDWNKDTKPPSSHSAEFDTYDDRKRPRRIAVRMMRESTPILRDGLKRISKNARYAELYILVDTIRPQLETILAHLSPNGTKKTVKKKASKKGPAPRRRGRRPGSSAERRGIGGKKVQKGFFGRLFGGNEETEDTEEEKPQRKKKKKVRAKKKTTAKKAKKTKAPSKKSKQSKPKSKTKAQKPRRKKSDPFGDASPDTTTQGLDPHTDGANGATIAKDRHDLEELEQDNKRKKGRRRRRRKPAGTAKP